MVAAEMVLSQWPRVETFKVHMMCQSVTNDSSLTDRSRAVLHALFRALDEPNAELEDLALKFTTKNNDYRWIPIELPAHLFSTSHFPELCSLSLGRCLIRKLSAHSHASDLQSLTLYNSRAWMDVDSMVQCLQTIPMLEILDYRFDAVPGPGDQFDCQPSRHYEPRCLDMQYLHYLNLSGFWIPNITIFNYIVVPLCCNVYINPFKYDQDFIDEIPETIVFQHMAMARETFQSHFAPAISRGEVLGSVHPTDEGMSASILGRETLLPSELALAFPETRNERIRCAAFGIFCFLPVFTEAECPAFNDDPWNISPDFYKKYTNVRQLVFDNRATITALTAGLHKDGTALFPMLSCISVGYDTVNDEDGLLALATALCSTHATTDRFKHLEVPKSRFSDELLDELRALLGPDRVQLRGF